MSLSIIASILIYGAISLLEFKAKVIQPWQGEIVGELLITNSKISFLGDVDVNTGIVTAVDLDIKGQNLHDRIFIFPEGRGSTVGSNVLYGLAKNGFAPRLIGTSRAEPITISGAIFGSIPMVSSIDQIFYKKLKNGDVLAARIEKGYAYLEKIR